MAYLAAAALVKDSSSTTAALSSFYLPKRKESWVLTTLGNQSSTCLGNIQFLLISKSSRTSMPHRAPVVTGHGQPVRSPDHNCVSLPWLSILFAATANQMSPRHDAAKQLLFWVMKTGWEGGEWGGGEGRNSWRGEFSFEWWHLSQGVREKFAMMLHDPIALCFAGGQYRMNWRVSQCKNLLPGRLAIWWLLSDVIVHFRYKCWKTKSTETGEMS